MTTNKATYVPYRGPWEIETWVRERLLDVIGRELGLDPQVVRERNLLRDDELPTTSVHRRRAPGLRPAADVRRRRGAARHRRLPGPSRSRPEPRAASSASGWPTCVEPAPVPPSLVRAMGIMAAPRTVQEARARLEPDGTVTVFTSQMPHGQSHETTLAQLAADELAVGLDQVRVVHGDTQLTPFNLVGTGGSRAATLASGAVVGAARAVRDRVLDVAAQLMEIDPADLELVDGAVVARGAPGVRTPLAEIGRLAYLRPGLANADGRPGHRGGGHLPVRGGHVVGGHPRCEVEVDPETGLVRDRAVRRRRGLRRGDQPGDRRRSGARRRRPGHRGRAARAVGLRPRRPVPVVDVHGPPAADRRSTSPASRCTTCTTTRPVGSTTGAWARAAPSARRPRSPTRSRTPSPISASGSRAAPAAVADPRAHGRGDRLARHLEYRFGFGHDVRSGSSGSAVRARTAPTHTPLL